ncbi:hypothetical protein [Streptomyces mangrovisoli]|uniref:Secreted protein n=1 Tax=Streptomyces mangrovisoli TaxID=1428628 RepID=A0A1J4P1D5_9ACTN|nr:hypothetical protein [Streptomyces mangrovisoli]OIJ68553.1 hypothetical protein WN71_007110 [Streptomyces mangrovisoli]
MKKRSMLAIASLATGFVVAAITPSQHATDHHVLGDGSLRDTLGALDHTFSQDSFGPADEAPAQTD